MGKRLEHWSPNDASAAAALAPIAEYTSYVIARILAPEYVGPVRSYPQTTCGTDSGRSSRFSLPRPYSLTSGAKEFRSKSSTRKRNGGGRSYGGSSGCLSSSGTVCIGRTATGTAAPVVETSGIKCRQMGDSCGGDRSSGKPSKLIVQQV